MRKLCLLLPLILATTACQNFTWKGQGAGLTEEQRALQVKDINALAREYDTKAYWAGLRRRADGRANAFGRDLNSIQQFFGRHFLNYSEDDPYVNYPSDRSTLGHLGRFGTTFVGSILR